MGFYLLLWTCQNPFLGKFQLKTAKTYWDFFLSNWCGNLKSNFDILYKAVWPLSQTLSYESLTLVKKGRNHLANQPSNHCAWHYASIFPLFSNQDTFFLFFLIKTRYLPMYLPMYLKSVAYNWDELLIKKLSIWVCI